MMKFRPIAAFLLSASVALAENPVHFRIKPAGAREAPPTVEDMLFMIAKPSRIDLTADLPGMCSVSNGEYGVRWHAGGWQRPFYIAEYSGLIHIPSGTEYTFFVRKPSIGPVYLLIDGVPVVDFPNRHVPRAVRGWRQRNASSAMDANLALADSGGTAMSLSDDVKVPDGWIAGKTIHLEKGPVEFRAISFCEHRADFGLRWLMRGQTEPSDIPGYLFKRAEGLRHTGVEGRKLIDRAADARLAGVPSFCYEEDAIRPEVHIRSNEASVDVVATMARNGTVFSAVTDSVDVVRCWGRVILPECRAGDCDLIEWVVRAKSGEALSRGAAQVLKPPFSSLPDRVDGAAFMRGSTNIVFVAKRWGEPRQPEPLPVGDNAGMVFVNGFGDAVSNVLSRALQLAFCGNAPVIGREIRIGDLSDDSEAMLGARDNIEVLNAVCASDAEFVLFAPEIRGARAAESMDAFERRLAATVGMISEGRGRNVVLATPPQCDGADMRPYAAVIHRVADAYGLRTADLYTASRIGDGK